MSGPSFSTGQARPAHLDSSKFEIPVRRDPLRNSRTARKGPSVYRLGKMSTVARTCYVIPIAQRPVVAAATDLLVAVVCTPGAASHRLIRLAYPCMRRLWYLEETALRLRSPRLLSIH